MRQAVLAVADQRDYLSAMAGDQSNWQTCFSFYACNMAEVDEQGGEALSGPRDYDKAKRLIAEAGYKGERIVVLDPADKPPAPRRSTRDQRLVEAARPQC